MPSSQDREEATKYKTLIETSPFAIITFSIHGYMTSCNLATTTLTGYKKEEILGKHFIKLKFLNKDSIKRCIQVIKNLVQGTHVNPTEFKYTTKKGEKRYAKTWLKYIDTPNNQREVLVIFDDITDRLALEKKLRESREQLDAFMQSATDGFSIFDSKLNLIKVNKTARDRFGVSENEIIGKNITELQPKIVESGLFDKYKQVIETEEPYFDEFSLDTPRHGLRHFTLKAFKTGDGLGIITTDITDRYTFQKRLELLHDHAARLAETEEREEVISITGECLTDVLGYMWYSLGFVKDGDLVFDHYWGYETDKTLRMPLDGLGVSVEAINTGKSILLEKAQESELYVSPLRNTPAGSELDVPIIIEGEAIGVINIESEHTHAFDINDQHLVETLAMHVGASLHRIKSTREKQNLQQQLFQERVRAKQAMNMERMKTRFVNTATHELRTPLTSMKGYLELALEEAESQSLKSYLNIAYRNTERLEALTSDLLDQQRLEEKRLEMNRTPVKVSKLISCVVEEMSTMITEREQHLTVSEPRESIVLNCDEMRLCQVLINLLDNASKYSPENTEINLSVKLLENTVQFSVSDEGYGLTSEEIDKLFKPFPNIERPVVSQQSVGLGLSICKGIVELHGGEIWAESPGKGKGSTFTFKIPVKK